jgi:hypothetical protein
MLQGEIVIYKASETNDFQLEVRVEDETVWLNRLQMAQLFGRDVKTIGKHISNALKEELRAIPVVAKFATTASDGKTYQVEYYSLDMIVSVGYRVKSERGVLFRLWANNVLKNYLLKGYAINQRFDKIEGDVWALKNKISEIDFQIKTNLPPNEGIFFDGQIFDAWSFVSNLVKSAKKSIILIDNYIDNSVLLLFAKRDIGVKATIFTSRISQQMQTDIEKYNAQYEKIEVRFFSKSHDRFLIIDRETVYHIGASLKDLGKKWFAFSKINLDVNEILLKIES